MTFHSIFKLENIPTEAEDGLEHPVTGDELQGMIAFTPYMLIAYLTALMFQAF